MNYQLLAFPKSIPEIMMHTRKHQVEERIQLVEVQFVGQCQWVFWTKGYGVMVYEAHNASILEIVGHQWFSINFQTTICFWVSFCRHLWGGWHDDTHNGRLGTCLSIRFRLDSGAFWIFYRLNYIWFDMEVS